MIGSEIRPIEITEAATTPVVAASKAPTKMTAKASPPRSGPNSWTTVSSRSSAIPLRERRVVGHHRPHALRQRLEQRRREQAELDTQQAEENAGGSEREGDRIADEHYHDQGREHERGHVLDQESAHAMSPRSLRKASARSSSSVGPSSFSVGSGMTPRRKAIRLISSETPCRISKKNPIGSISRPRQTVRPPALVEPSPLR